MKIERNTDAELALIILGNYLIENYAHLRNSGATGCRCMSCYSWQVVALNDDKDQILLEAETLTELINLIPDEHG